MKIDPNKFWQWAYRDFISNAIRGILAEYLVHKAIHFNTSKRLKWDVYELVTVDRLKIEEKGIKMNR